jgi:hypothetical protein
VGCVKLGLVTAVMETLVGASSGPLCLGSCRTETQGGVGCVLVWQSGLVMSCSVWVRQLR